MSVLILRRFRPEPPVLLRRFGPDGRLSALAERAEGAAVPVAIAPPVPSSDGWGNYFDTAAAQALAANVRTLVSNNSGTVSESQLPPDLPSFLAASRIRGALGDALVVRIKLTVTPADGSASKVRIELDAGAGVIDEFTEGVSSGLGVPHRVSKTVALYVGANFAANGCGIFVTVDGPVTLSAKALLVLRGAKAR